MENTRVRIRDIAEELGISTATVSNVLHGKTKKISDETVKRVQALLEERQYVPSMAGILLAQNSSRIIGVVVNDHEKYENHTLEDVFIAASINHLSTEIEKNGQFMMIKKATKPEEIIRFASMWNLDGLVLIGYCDEDYMYLRDHMRIPFVVYDGYCKKTERICNITIDHYDGGRQVGEYLRKSGHKNVLCIADNEVCMDKERCDGFRDGFLKGGYFEGVSKDTDGFKQKVNADFLRIPMQKKERMLFYEKHLTQIKKYTAIFAVSDFYAIELMQFLNENGMRVPENISIIGFDDIPMCQMTFPALTTVKQDVQMRAEIALRKLNDFKEQRETETEVKLPVQLVIRESSIEVS